MLAQHEATERVGRTSVSDARRVLLSGLPIIERRLFLAGASTSELEAGDGSPLILLHGGIAVGGAYWAPIIPALAQQHRVIVPDVPGIGESDPVAGPRIDQALFDAWLVSLLEHTCTAKPTIIAHSLIGSFAARFAARHSDLLGGLAIYGAPGVGPYRLPLGLMYAALLFDLRPSLAAQRRFVRLAFRDPDATRTQHPEWFDAFDAYCVERGKIPHVKRSMRQLVGRGTKQIAVDDMRRIAVPTVLVWGRHDRMVQLKVAELAAARTGWPLHVIESAGHVPHLEQPDAFLAALETLLSPRHTTSTGSTR
jgi:2-hydroxymuconate-semialdehyde hydrolase